MDEWKIENNEKTADKTERNGVDWNGTKCKANR